MQPVTIGLLMPRSDMYPGIAPDFRNGFEFAINSANLDEGLVNNFIEPIGNAADDRHIQISEKLLLDRKADLIVSFGSSHNLNELKTLFEVHKRPLIHVDLGGYVLRKAFQSPNVLYHSLNLWQSAYESGKLAAEKIGKRAMVISSFYDGGYHLTACLTSGFTDNGGEITNYYVSPMDYHSDSFDALIQGIRENDPDLLLGIFSFNESKKVFKTIAESGLDKNLPIITIPTMTDETIHSENYGLDNVQSLASWSFDDDTEAMRTFVSDFKEFYDEAPNIMSLLGYEVGLTVAKCLEQEGSIPVHIGNFMQDKTLLTPRGELRFSSRHETVPSDFKIRKFQFNNVKYHNTVVGHTEVPEMDTLYDRFESLPDTNWKNPYICT